MRPVHIDDILPNDAFVRERPRLLAEVSRAKDVRRLALGPNLILLFENRVTVRWQIQEMCRVENISKPEAIAHEIESYNDLLPTPTELSATLMIAFPDPDERARRLSGFVGLGRHVRLEIDGVPAIPARFDEGREDPAAHRISAVHFVRVPLDAPARDAFLDLGREARFVVDHPAYQATATLPRAVRGAIADDLASD